jgi:hypothetical protein
MIFLKTGKYKDPRISHRFFVNGIFHRFMKKKGYKLSKGFFLEKSENLTHLEEKKKYWNSPCLEHRLIHVTSVY